jgi:ferredoxin
MPHAINKDDCIQCGACEAECPSNSISMDAEGYYVIDAATCEDCGDCVNVCPSGAISKL